MNQLTKKFLCKCCGLTVVQLRIVVLGCDTVALGILFLVLWSNVSPYLQGFKVHEEILTCY